MAAAQTSNLREDSPVDGISSDSLKLSNACVTCAQRKIKCDRRNPCSACTKSHSQCIYRAPAPPQRRKRKQEHVDQVMLRKLRKYEEALMSAGLLSDPFDPADLDHASPDDSHGIDGPSNAQTVVPDRSPTSNHSKKKLPECPTSAIHTGTLVADGSGQRYYEHKLLANLSKEFKQDPVDVIQDEAINEHGASHQSICSSLASGLVLGLALPQVEPASHPGPTSIMKLWTVFLDNVNPLTKVLHAPSVRKLFLDATADLGSVRNSTEVLMYSIYSCAVMSMSESECQTLFGCSQRGLIAGYQSAAQRLLLDSAFLKSSDLVLLQAYILLLTSMQQDCHPRSFWILIGVAIRIAQGLGLHRDGAALGLSPFESELRRRTWWYIIMLDFRSTELAGAGMSLFPNSWDTLLPLNVNDLDLEPSMTALPPERVGATEMSFCLLRYEIGRFTQQSRTLKAVLDQGSGPVDSKKQRILDFENMLEASFVRFCDPLVPLHVLITITARSIIYRMMHRRLMSRYARSSSEKPLNMSENDRDMALAYSIKQVEYDNLLCSTRSTRRFSWFVRNSFPWGAVVYLFENLAARPACDDGISNVWQLVEELYENRTELSETKKALHVIVGNLTLKAWAAREAAMTAQGLPPPFQVPAFINRLRSRRPITTTPVGISLSDLCSRTEGDKDMAENGRPRERSYDGNWNSFFTPDYETVDMTIEPINWTQWNCLLEELE